MGMIPAETNMVLLPKPALDTPQHVSKLHASKSSVTTEMVIYMHR
jgi:hypothetical protein